MQQRVQVWGLPQKQQMPALVTGLAKAMLAASTRLQVNSMNPLGLTGQVKSTGADCNRRGDGQVDVHIH